MPSIYGIKEYRVDLALAEARYTEVIRSYCVSNGAVIAISVYTNRVARSSELQAQKSPYWAGLGIRC